jgi:hypothetical protein
MKSLRKKLFKKGMVVRWQVGTTYSWKSPFPKSSILSLKISGKLEQKFLAIQRKFLIKSTNVDSRKLLQLRVPRDLFAFVVNFGSL